MYDDFDDGNIGGYCVYDPDYSLHVDMVNENSSLAISGRLGGDTRRQRLFRI